MANFCNSGETPTSGRDANLSSDSAGTEMISWFLESDSAPEVSNDILINSRCSQVALHLQKDRTSTNVAKKAAQLGVDVR